MASYHVKKATGNDTNDGLTEGNAWATINKANTDMVAGDDVTIYSDGTVYTDPIDPQNSGTSGNPIIYKNNSGDSNPVIIRASSGGYDLYISTKDWIEVRGTDISGQKGFLLGGTAMNNLGKNMEISFASNIIVDGVEHAFSDSNNAGLTLHGSSGNYCEDINIVNCKLYIHSSQWWNAGKIQTSDLTRFLNPKDSGNGIQTSGDSAEKYVRRVRFKNCEIVKYGGHTALDINAGDKLIFDSCILDGDWSDIVDGETVTNANGTVGSYVFDESVNPDDTDGSMESNNAKRGLEGSRLTALKTQGLVGENLLMIQGCTFLKMWYPPDQDRVVNKLHWRNYIHRYNVHYEESDGVGQMNLSINSGPYDSNIQHQFYYNNTIVRSMNSGFCINIPNSAADQVTVGDIHYLNNVHHKIGYRNDLMSATWQADATLAFHTGNDTTVDDVCGIDCRGNLVDSDAMFYVQRNANQTQTLTQVESNYPSNFANNFAGTPTFNGGAVTSLTAYSDFELTEDSEGIDAGVHLTTTTSSGTSTTMIPVAHAGFFFDGWGISDETGTPLVGDTIRIEQIVDDPNPATVTITAVSYGAFGTAAGTLTVDTPINYPNNAKIWTNYSGAAPNIGISQNASSPPPGGGGGSAGNPTFKNAHNNSSDSASSLVITPSGGAIPDGRFMVAVIGVTQNKTVTTPPTGWTLKTDTTGPAGMPSGSRYPHLYIYTKTASSEPASYTWTFDSSTKCVGSILEWSGVGASPLEIDVYAGETAASGTHNIPQMTGTSFLSDNVTITLAGDTNANPAMTGASGYTTVTDLSTNAGTPNKFLDLIIGNKDGAGGTVAAATVTSSIDAFSITAHLSIQGDNSGGDGGGDPTYVACYSTTNDGTSITITPTSTIPDGDFMVAVIGHQANKDIDTAPAGWTEVVDEDGTWSTGGTYRPRVHVYKRIAASEPTSYTWNLNGSIRVCGAIMHWSNPSTTPLEVSSVSPEDVLAATHDLLSLGGTSNNSDIVAINLFGNESATAIAITSPAGYTEIADQFLSSGTPVRYSALNISRKAGTGGTIAATNAITDETSYSVNVHLAIAGFTANPKSKTATMDAILQTGTPPNLTCSLSAILDIGNDVIDIDQDQLTIVSATPVTRIN